MADVATLGIQVKMDGVTQAGKGLDGLSASAGKVEQATGGVASGSAKASNSLNVFAKSGSATSTILAGGTKSIAGALAVVTAGFIAMAAGAVGLQRSIALIAGFEQSMSQVSAITRATSSELAEMREVAKSLGDSTEFSASQAANALKFLGQAGFSASEAVAAIPAVLDLATAASIGLAEAADISSNIMSGFGLSANQAAEAADILAAAASRSNTDVAQLGDAMKFAAPVAASLKISMGDAAAAIGVLSDAGIQGSQAGTGLRAVLASLVKPAKEGQRALAAMGLTTKDVNPATKSLADIMDLLRSRGLNAQAAMMLFGREAASAGLAMAASSKHLGELSDEMKNVNGEALRMATTMRDNLMGDLDDLSSSAEGLIIALGEAGLTAVIRSVTQAITGSIRFVSELAKYLDVAAYSVGVFSVAMLSGYIPAVATAVFSTAALTTALTALRIAIAATGIGLIVIAIGGAIAALMRAREASDSWGAAFELLSGRIGNIMRAIRFAFYTAVDAMRLAWSGLVLFMLQSLNSVGNSIAGKFGLSFSGFDKEIADQKANMVDYADFVKVQSGIIVSEMDKAFASFGNADGFIGPMQPPSSGAVSDLVKELGDISTASKDATDKYKELLTAAKQRTEQMEQEVKLVGLNSIAADVLRMKLDMLQSAQQDGLKLSQAQKDALNAQADAYGKAAQKVAELTLMEDARFARAQLGRSAIEQRIASDLKGAGLEMDSVAGQAYASYAKLTDMIGTAKEEAKSFASGFINDLLNGKSAMEALSGALQKLANKLIDMALDEMINGLFKNLLGIFGGGMGGGSGFGTNYFPAAPSGGIGLFADGGISNKPAIFGEAGPEAAVPLPDGRSIPVTLNGGSGSGGGETVNSGNVYNFTGTSEEFQQFKQFVMQREKSFNARAQDAVKKGAKHNVGFN